MEQSNSSVIYDDKIYLKLFRKLEEGINPDLELTKQLSDKCGFQHVPTYLGDIQYVVPGQDPASLRHDSGIYAKRTERVVSYAWCRQSILRSGLSRTSASTATVDWSLAGNSGAVPEHH